MKNVITPPGSERVLEMISTENSKHSGPSALSAGKLNGRRPCTIRLSNKIKASAPSVPKQQCAPGSSDVLLDMQCASNWELTWPGDA